MKLLLAALISAALFGAIFLVPIGGHTLWQRAEARGLPQSAARAMSNGAHAAVRWAEEKRAHAGSNSGTAPRRLLHKEIARSGEPSSRSTEPPLHSSESSSHLSEAHYRNGAPTADVPAQPPLAHDHIVAAPAREHLSEGDRQGLDKLIAGSRAQR